MKNKKISVIVIGDNKIEECLVKIEEQSYINDIEVIVICSKDKFNNIEKNYPHIKFIEKKKNIFKDIEININKITGDYIAILNSEDTITIDYYRTMVETAIKKNADIVMSNVILQYSDGGRAYLNLSEATLKILEKKEILNEYLSQSGIAFLWSLYGNKIYSTELFKRAIKDVIKIDDNIQDFYFVGIVFYYSQKIIPITNEVLFYNFEEDTSEVIRQFIREDMIQEGYLYENAVNNFKYLEEFLNKKNIKYDIEDWKKLYLNKDKKLEKNILLKTKTAWNNNLDKMKREIISEKTKVVSFDIFDTLVVRPFWNQIDLFSFMDEKFRKINNIETGINFSKIRVEAEINVRKKLDKQDVTLEDIYKEIKHQTDSTDEIIEIMQNTEQELEIRFCRERKTGKELYELAKYLGKKVICISDIYLPLETINKILSKNKYNINQVYLSSEINLTKFNGDLYDFVISDLNVSTDEIVHIGDNYHSDYKTAKEQGINAQFFPKAIDVFCNENITNALSDLFKKNIPIWENNTNGLNFLGIRSMLALVANKYFDNPYRTFNNESDFNIDPNLIGYYVLGMHLFGIADWLIKNTINEKYDKIVFFARDGYWTMKAYQILKKIYKNPPNEEYLYISRRALIPVTLNNKFDFYKLSELINIYKYTPKTILKYINSILTNLEKLDLECRKEGINIDKKFENKTEFNIYMNLIINKFYDKHKHEEIIRKLTKYFSTIFSGKSCAFDIGYSAKPEMYLSILCKKPIDTFFINISNEEALEHSETGNFKLYTYFDYKPSITGVVRESLMSTSGPSCIGYDFDKNDKIIHIFDEENAKYKDRFLFDAMQNKAIEFIQDVVENFQNDIERLFYERYYISLPHEMYINSAKKLDQEIFYSLKLEDSIGLGKNITAIEEWNHEMYEKNQKRTEELFDTNLVSNLKTEIKNLSKKVEELEEKLSENSKIERKKVKKNTTEKCRYVKRINSLFGGKKV